MLPGLDPVVALVNAGGESARDWLFANKPAIGWCLTAAFGLGAVAAGRAGRTRAAAPLLLFATLAALSWGQIHLLAGHDTLGTALYLAGFLAAVGVGRCVPLKALPGFRPLFGVAPPRSGDAGPAPRFGPREAAGVLLLTVVALLSRLYALTELAATFDGEMVDSHILSRTAHGLAHYMRNGFVTGGAGAVTPLTQFGLFRVYGTSIYTLRLTSALWGTAAVPLCYWLLRRLAGRAAAWIAALLLVAAPEQLSWARADNPHLAAATVLSLGTALVGLCMIERYTSGALLAAALWMPFGRFFSTPGLVAFAYPLGLFAHAVVCVPGAWRKASQAVPRLALGFLLWSVCLPIVQAGSQGGTGQSRDPALARGALARGAAGLGKEGKFRDAAGLQRLRLRAETIASNGAEALAALTSSGAGTFSRFGEPAGAPAAHRPWINAGCGVAFFGGFGYLLGQLRDPRAFALIWWVVLGLLPGLTSSEPEPGRLSLFFPAVYAVAAVFMVAAVRLLREGAARVVAGTFAVALTAGLGVALSTNLASYFRLDTRRAGEEELVRFTRPLFEGSDIILTNLDRTGHGRVAVFGNLDSFLRSRPCYQEVGPKGWPDAILRPRCTFAEWPYEFLVPDDDMAKLRRSFVARRVSYLFEDSAVSRRTLGLLRSLHPRADVRRAKSSIDERQWLSMTVDIGKIDALRMPEVSGPGVGRGTSILEGVRMRPAAVEAGAAVVVRAGLLLPADGWYRFGVTPACRGAGLRIDEQPADELQPRLAGVHAFEVTLKETAVCTLPLRVVAATSASTAPGEAIAANQFLSPGLANVPMLQAGPAGAYDGYGEVAPFAQLPPGAVDIGVDDAGVVSALVREPDGAVVKRFAPDGKDAGGWRPEKRLAESAAALLVEPDGTTIVLAGLRVEFYAPDGRKLREWVSPWDLTSSQATRLSDGRLLVSYVTHDRLILFSGDGRVEKSWEHFDGGPGHFEAPRSVTVGPDGVVVVIQDDGLALVFRDPGGPWNPVFQGSFSVDLGTLPISTRGCAIDAAMHLLVPDASTAPLVYALDGTRLMARDPARDLKNKTFGQPGQLLSAGNRIYALDRHRNEIWAIGR